MPVWCAVVANSRVILHPRTATPADQMCLSFISWNVHPALFAVILFNRDEYLDRCVPHLLTQRFHIGARRGEVRIVSSSETGSLVTSMRKPPVMTPRGSESSLPCTIRSFF
jgi:hypothetical protein